MSFKLLKNTQAFGVAYWIPGIFLFLILLAFTMVVYPGLLRATFTWIFIFAPLWAPIILFGMLVSGWLQYNRAKYIAGRTPVLLEIKIPRQILKTPKAMELVFTGLHIGPGETTFIGTLIHGKVRPWWSLEIVSIEGKIHFYVWTWDNLREFTESQFYAQYPDIEIQQVEDYTSGVFYDPEKVKVWAMEYGFAKSDAYPIKTYVDYELDQQPRTAEQIIDPLSGLLEKISAIGPGQQIWIQMIIRQNKGASTAPISTFSGGTEWKKEAQKEIDEIYEAAKPKDKDLVTGEISEGYPLLKPSQVNVIKALERSVDKPGYDIGIRTLYVTRPDSFEGHKIPPYIVNLFNSFGSDSLNKIQPRGPWHVILDYPWQDFMNIRATRFSHKSLDAYRRRSMFHAPYSHARMVMTTEEIATIFHFPTEETRSPGLERIESKRGEAPTNLPT